MGTLRPVTAYARDFAGDPGSLEHEPAPRMPKTTGEVGALRVRAGQSVALARQLQPAAEIVAELVSGL